MITKLIQKISTGMRILDFKSIQFILVRKLFRNCCCFRRRKKNNKTLMEKISTKKNNNTNIYPSFLSVNDHRLHHHQEIRKNPQTKHTHTLTTNKVTNESITMDN